MIFNEHIQKRLAEAIKQSGKTQTQIAKELNISTQTISHYVRGNKMPSLETFANLCKLLDVDTNYILCQED